MSTEIDGQLNNLPEKHRLSAWHRVMSSTFLSGERVFDTSQFSDNSQQLRSQLTQLPFQPVDALLQVTNCAG